MRKDCFYLLKASLRLWPLILFVIFFSFAGSFVKAEETIDLTENTGTETVLYPVDTDELSTNLEMLKDPQNEIQQEITPVITEENFDPVVANNDDLTGLNDDLTPLQNQFETLEPIESVVLSARINEVLFNSIASASGEFIELYNDGQGPIDLSNWYIKDASSKDDLVLYTKKTFIEQNSFILKPGCYALILDSDYASEYDDLISKSSCSIILTTPNSTLGNGLGNQTDYIELYDQNNNLIDKFDWENQEESLKGYSLEYVDNKLLPSLSLGGTPGFKNSASYVPLIKTKLLQPQNLAEIVFSEFYKFTWDTTVSQVRQIQIAQDIDFNSIIIDENITNETEYRATNLDIGSYFWRIVSQNNYEQVISETYSFKITQPTYSDKVVVNEIFPDPSSDETKNEWIELYNNSDVAVNLKNWCLADMKGSVKKFCIDYDLILAPFGYELFYRSETQITLNNDTDGVRLYQPDGNIIFESSIYEQGESEWAYILKPNGKWDWSTKPTPGKKNIIAYPTLANAGGADEPLPSLTPIKIKTGDTPLFQNQRVEVSGEITSISGNTIYINDGSGAVKIYIQEITGIKKPLLVKGDEIRICGWVNLYRKVFRILPQLQSDIYLIKKAPVKAKTSSSTKKTTVKTTTKKIIASPPTKSVPNIRPPNFTSKVLASSDTQNNIQTKKQNVFVQILKLITGLAGVFLVVLLLKPKFEKRKILGGHFGEDET